MKNLQDRRTIISMFFLIAAALFLVYKYNSKHDALPLCTESDNLWMPSLKTIAENSVVLQTNDLRLLTVGEKYEIDMMELDVEVELLKTQSPGAYFLYTREYRSSEGLNVKSVFQCEYYALSKANETSASGNNNISRLFSGLNKKWNVKHAVLIDGVKEQFTLASLKQYAILVNGKYEQEIFQSVPYEMRIDITEYDIKNKAIKAFNDIKSTSGLHHTIITEPPLLVDFESKYSYCFEDFNTGCVFVGQTNNTLIQIELYFIDEIDFVGQLSIWENLVLTIEKNFWMIGETIL
jgi:hypothetical protein